MRIGVPLFGRDVAPRFCAADRLLLVEVREGRAVSETEVALADEDIPRRLLRLRALEVDRLLCGGFSRRFVPLAETLGIGLVWGLVGDAREAARAFLAGTGNGGPGRGPDGPPGPWCRRRRWPHAGGR